MPSSHHSLSANVDGPEMDSPESRYQLWATLLQYTEDFISALKSGQQWKFPEYKMPWDPLAHNCIDGVYYCQWEGCTKGKEILSQLRYAPH